MHKNRINKAIRLLNSLIKTCNEVESWFLANYSEPDESSVPPAVYKALREFHKYGIFPSNKLEEV